MSSGVASAQLAIQTPGDKMVQALRTNAVAIRAEWTEDGARSDGFGFITAVEGGYTYVATANHVVRGYEGDNQADKVTVRFFGSRKPMAATVLKSHDQALDIGVIKVKGKPTRSWYRAASGVGAKTDRGTLVRFIGRSGTWYTPARPGTVNYIDPDLGLVLEGLSVIVGTSGAPLISADGIVGLMTTDAAGDLSRACPIGDVRKKLRSWKVPWQLVPPDLNRLPPGSQVSARAIADAARLAERMGDFKRAGVAAKRAFKQDKTNAEAAQLVLSAATNGEWSLCHLEEPNSCATSNPYFSDAPAALAAIRKSDKTLAKSEEVLGAEIRLLRMQGKLKAAAVKAEKGLKLYPQSHWFLAEAGAARARAGKKEGITMLAQAEQEAPSDALYRAYSLQALADAGDPIALGKQLPAGTEMTTLYQKYPQQYAKLAPLLMTKYAKLMWKGLRTLSPKFEADTAGDLFAYDELVVIMERHKHTGGYDAKSARLKAVIYERTGKTQEAVAAARQYVSQAGSLNSLIREIRDGPSDKQRAATKTLKYYHGVLARAQAEPLDRYIVERYANIGVADTVAYQPWPEDKAPLMYDGYEGRTTVVALTDPPTMAFSASANSVRQWRMPKLEPSDFVITPRPVCAMVPSKDGRTVAFVTEAGRAFLWKPRPSSTLVALRGSKKAKCLVAMSPDGKSVAVVSAKGRLLTWPTTASKKQKPTVGPKLPWEPSHLSLTAAGSMIAASKDKAAFATAKARTKAKPKTFTCGSTKKVTGVTTDGASGQVASVAERLLTVCRAANGQVVATTKIGSGKEHDINFQAEGKLVTFLQDSYGVYIYNLETPKKRPRGRSAFYRMSGLALTKDSEFALGIGTRDGELVLNYESDPKTGRRAKLKRHNDRSQWAKVTIDPSLQYLGLAWTTSDRQEGLSIYDLAANKDVCSDDDADSGYGPILSAGAKQLRMVKPDHSSGEVFDTKCKEVGRFYDGFYSPSGAMLAQEKNDNIVIVRPGDPKKTERILPCNIYTVDAGAFSVDETMFVATDGRFLCFADLKTGQVERVSYSVSVPNFGTVDDPTTVRFSPDGKSFVFADENGAIDRWDLAQKRRIGAAPGPRYWERHATGLPRLVVEPNSDLLTLTGQGDVMRWNANNELSGLAHMGARPFHIDLSSDGSKVIVMSYVDKSSMDVRILHRRDLSPAVGIRAFSFGRWLALTPDGRCWGTKGTDAAVIPSFVVSKKGIKKTARTCRDRSVLAAISPALASTKP